MILECCYIEGFGKLRERTFRFDQGLNVLCEENGFGKSTLAAFIKAMFYGLSENKKQSLLENERKHYTPWDNGAFGGYIIFRMKQARLRIERTFGARPSEDTFAIYNCESGMAYEMQQRCAGEEFFGIDADGFERTVFLGEKLLEEKNDNPTIAKRLSELVGVGGDTMDASPALSLLEDQRKVYYKRGGKGRIGEVSEDIATLTNEIGDLLRLKDEARALEEQRLELTAQLAECDECRRKLERKKAEMPSRSNPDAEIERANAALVRANAALEEERRFFAKAPTTHEELGRMQARSLQLVALKKEAASAVYKKEEIPLPATSYEEIYRMQRLYEDAMRIEEAPEEPNARYEELHGLFSDIQKAKEPFAETAALFARKSAQRGRRRLLGALSCLISLAFLVGGIFLPYLFVGTALFGLLGLYLLIKKQDDPRTRVMKLLYEKARKTGESVGDFCRRITALYEEYLKESELVKSHEEKRTQAARERGERLAIVEEYLSRFPELRGQEPTLAFKKLLHSVTERSLNLERSEHAERENLRLSDEIAALERELAAYLSFYPTLTGEPFSEIREHLVRLAKCEETVDAYTQQLARYSADESAGVSARWSALDEEERALREGKDALLERRAILDARLHALGERLSELDEKEARLSELREEKEASEKTLATILDTMSLLKQAKENLTLRYLKGTKEGFEKYVALFDGKSDGEFYMTPTFEVSKSDLGRIHNSEAYSKGTRDLYALAARFSLIGALYEKEKPFLLLDDPFASFDDERMRNSLSLLRKLAEDMQVIYFTCSSSRV